MKYSNYDYKKKDQLLPSSPKMSLCLKGDKISPALIRLLYLGENEEILFYKSLNLRKFKNGKNIFRKLLVITPVNLILASYKSFYIPMPKRWTERDVIPLSDIVAIEGKMKYFFMYTDKRPFLIIRSTQNDVYEIELSSFAQNIGAISEITDIIKKLTHMSNLP